MGYAARLNPNARHFDTPAGMAKNRAAARERQRAIEAEFDRLVEEVHAPDALDRFGPVRLSAARADLARRGRLRPDVSESVRG